MSLLFPSRQIPIRLVEVYELVVTTGELRPRLRVRGIQIGRLPETRNGGFDGRPPARGHPRRLGLVQTLQIMFVGFLISRGMPRQAGLPRAVEMETELSRHLAGDFILDIENVAERHVKRLRPEGCASGRLNKIEAHADAVAGHLQTPVEDGIYFELAPGPKRVRAGFHVLTDRAGRPDSKPGNPAHSSNNAVCNP